MVTSRYICSYRKAGGVLHHEMVESSHFGALSSTSPRYFYKSKLEVQYTVWWRFT